MGLSLDHPRQRPEGKLSQLYCEPYSWEAQRDVPVNPSNFIDIDPNFHHIAAILSTHNQSVLSLIK